MNHSEPFAHQIPHEHSLHGDIRQDPYSWLNQRALPEVRAYLEAENEYLEEQLASVKPLREQLYEEMLSRIKQDDSTVPYRMGGFWYYTRFEQSKEYPIFCRKPLAPEGCVEEILLNANDLAEGKPFCHVIPPKTSPDENKMLYAVDFTGRNLHHAHVKDLKTGRMLEEDSPVVAGDFAWTPDNDAFFYTTKDALTLRSDKVWLHTLGTPYTNDRLVYEETDETCYVHLSTSKDKTYLFLSSGYTETVKCHYIPLENYHLDPVCFLEKEDGIYYQVDHFKGWFYILHNHDAPNFRLSRTPVTAIGVETWETLIDHQEEVLLQDIEFFTDFLVIHERSNGMNQLRVQPIEWDQASHVVRFPDASYDCWLGANKELDTHVLRLHYTSMVTPISTFDYDMNLRQLHLLKEQPVLGGFDKGTYHSEYLLLPARDGKKIPVSLVYREGFVKNGMSPLLLNGYGSYGICYDPAFSSHSLSLLDRGFVIAIAHIRGGKELGWSWYETGKLMHKMNSFHDFIDCAEGLIQLGYTTNERLFARGGSAGGLLMGAVLNLRPDLFKGVLAHVPFVDVLTTMSDPDIPLTTGEYQEWGNPNIASHYFYMKQYSPYDNVEKKDYTNVLVTTGFSDSQVQYWEPAKWVARLRTHRTDLKHLLLFYTNLEAGHGGASGRFERLKELALDYAFMLYVLERNS